MDEQEKYVLEKYQTISYNLDKLFKTSDINLNFCFTISKYYKRK